MGGGGGPNWSGPNSRASLNLAPFERPSLLYPSSVVNFVTPASTPSLFSGLHALAGCLLSCGSCLRLSFRLGSVHPAATVPFLCLTAAPLRRNWVPLRGNDLSAGCCIYLPTLDHLVSCLRPFYFDFISILYTDSLAVT